MNLKSRDLAVELPFTLTHPKPPPTPSPSRQFDEQSATDVPIDHNLIQLDAKFVWFQWINKYKIELFVLVSMALVMMMILFSKNSLVFVLKGKKLVPTIPKLNLLTYFVCHCTEILLFDVFYDFLCQYRITHLFHLSTLNWRMTIVIRTNKINKSRKNIN